MIKESVKKLGDYSLEIKFKYRPDAQSRFITNRKYFVDMYFFLPLSLGVNRKNYTKMDFYRELNSYLKIDPPKVLLSELIKAEDQVSRLVIDAFKNYNPDKEESLEDLEGLLKIYLNVFKKAVKRELRGMNKVNDLAEKVRLARRLIKNFDLGLERFRKLETYLREQNFENTSAYRVYSYADEYMSTLYSKYLYHVWQSFEYEENDGAPDVRSSVTDAIFKEREYKETKGYPLAEPKHNSKKNEKFLYRWEMIKNFVNRKLILTTRFDKENKWLIQFYYSLAAGIAMIFATAVAFYYNQKFGNFTMRFFVVLVVSYMFKDRIKEWIKELINYLLRKETYDQSINIYDENGNVIGKVAQGFNFVSMRNLPKKILEARNSTHQTDIEDNSIERVMHYKMRIKLNAKKLYNVFKHIRIRGINDVTYFNTSPLLMRMERPETKILLVDEQKNFNFYRSEKVYHINMILVYRYKDMEKIKRYRIVLNRNGIKQVKAIPAK